MNLQRESASKSPLSTVKSPVSTKADLLDTPLEIESAMKPSTPNKLTNKQSLMYMCRGISKDLDTCCSTLRISDAIQKDQCEAILDLMGYTRSSTDPAVS